MTVTHKRSYSYHPPRALCGRLRTSAYPPHLTDIDAEVSCLRCVKRMEVGAEVKRLWAKREAEKL